MGNFAVLQEIRLTAPKVTGVGTSCKEIKKNIKPATRYLRTITKKEQTDEIPAKCE